MVQSTEPRAYITVPDGDPQIGNFFTPINNTPIIKLFIDWLPINRPGISSLARGLEIGMAHGYWLVGPFSQLGPLRSEPVGLVVGLLGAATIVLLMTIALNIYGYATPGIDTPVGDSKGWSEFSSGFLIGGVGGAVVAYLLLLNVDLVTSGFNLAL
ncbi:MAG: photosystem I reaction center subunit XI [Cyanobacteriota bacterium]|nr:photosystem I reaction center subunit XI [Cyanobacteriota bacterium]